MRPTLPRLPIVALVLAAASLPCAAQFKIVDADGRVTYTDRPPAISSGTRITKVRRDGVVGTEAAAPIPLPLELRQVAARFPVTLYATTDCAPCDSGRRLLRARGIPHSERSIADDVDADALLRLSNGRTVPTLTVGAQVLRGFAESDWQSTLDLAGYPRESKLPRDYPHAAATPLVPRPSEPAPSPIAAAERPAEPPTPAPVESAASEPSIRF